MDVANHSIDIVLQHLLPVIESKSHQLCKDKQFGYTMPVFLLVSKDVYSKLKAFDHVQQNGVWE